MWKRKCQQRTEREKLELLKQWKLHPDWNISDASRELGVKEPTLRGWKSRYWEGLDSAVGSERKRRKGGGRKHKMKPYEWRVIEYVDNVRQDRECSFEDILFYCRSIDEFKMEFPNPLSQKSWVNRFIVRNPPDRSSNPVVPANGENSTDTRDSNGVNEHTVRGGGGAADERVAREDEEGYNIESGELGDKDPNGDIVIAVDDAVDACVQPGGSDRSGATTFSAGNIIRNESRCNDGGVRVLEMKTSMGSTAMTELVMDPDPEDKALPQAQGGCCGALEQFDEFVKKKKISVAEVGELRDAISRKFRSAANKRPKAYSIKIDPARVIETDIGFVLPETLVLKCIESAKNLRLREQHSDDTNLTTSEIAVSVLDVGTFRLVDIKRMKKWYEVSEMIAKARKLMQFVQTATIDDPHEEAERQRILRIISRMGVTEHFTAGGHDIPFMELAGFGGEQWLNDSCVYLASVRVAREAMKHTWRQPVDVSVVDSIFMQMTDLTLRDRYIDGKNHIFSQMQSNRIICCPTYIDVNFPHWCGIIFDMERQTVWKYDPLHKAKCLDEVEAIITSVYMKIMKPKAKMRIRTFPGVRQRDGHSCGVLIVHWFELYLSVARSTPPDASLPTARGEELSSKQLAYERYKHFSYVFDFIAGSG